MISNTREEAIKTAVDHVRAGHTVAIIAGRGVDIMSLLRGIAERLPRAIFEGGRVKIDGVPVVFPRNPFLSGSGLHGFRGAVVIDPSFRSQLFGNGEVTLQRIVQECHRRAGITA